jgi:phenylpyruvate tautomerase PptA (4-oxalocrotonate tautomerase family)
MPVLRIETNQKLSQEQTTDLMERSTDMLCRVLEKPKTFMMVYVDAGCNMMFNGNTAPFAFVQLRQFAFEENQTAEIITAISSFVTDELDVSQDRQYIQLMEMKSSLFGWDGKPC